MLILTHTISCMHQDHNPPPSLLVKLDLLYLASVGIADTALYPFQPLVHYQVFALLNLEI